MTKDEKAVIIDLLTEKDTGFIGALGELVAWKYLWRHKGIFCLRFSGSVSFTGTWSATCENRGLSKQQVTYLERLQGHVS